MLCAYRKKCSVSSLFELSVVEWMENRITEGAFDGLRAAIQVDPANARLTAHFGKALADYALETGSEAVLFREKFKIFLEACTSCRRTSQEAR